MKSGIFFKEQCQAKLFCWLWLLLFGGVKRSSAQTSQSGAKDSLKNIAFGTRPLKTPPAPFLKNIVIDRRHPVLLSINGQLREVYQYYNNEKWGDISSSWIDRNGFYWHRLVLSSDLQIGKRVNLFGELNADLISSRAGGKRPSVDYNELGFSQLYLNVAVWSDLKSSISLKVGRQLCGSGSQRLITTREGPNNRLSFDAATAIFRNEKFTLSTLIARPIYNNFYAFDDRPVRSETLWGINLRSEQDKNRNKWELYYYGYYNAHIKLAGQFGKDVRHSVGLYYTGSRNQWKLEAEPVFQFGKFNTKKILAYSAFLKLQREISWLKQHISPGIALAAFSGDRKSNAQHLNTYNPMYPKPLFGLIAPLGPSNLLVINPEIEMEPSRKVLLAFATDMYWRYSHADGLYSPAAGPSIMQLYPGDEPAAVHSRFIGTDYKIKLDYTVDRNLAFGFEGGYFIAKKYLKQTGKGKNITYLSARIKFVF